MGPRSRARHDRTPTGHDMPGRTSVPHSIDEAFPALPLRALADAALARARALGAEHADFRFERVRSASWRLRDAKPAGSSDTTDLGYAVRVVHGGTWGFASGVDLTMDAAARVAAQAVAMAKLSAQVIAAAGSDERVELADEPVHADADLGLVVRDRPVRRARRGEGGAARRVERAAAGGRRASTTSTPRCSPCTRTSSTPTRPGTVDHPAAGAAAPAAHRGRGRPSRAASSTRCAPSRRRSAAAGST